MITALTTMFTLITVGAIVAVLYRFRRWPVVALIRRAERRVSFHRNAMTMLASAMRSAEAEGKRDEFDRLASSYRLHRDSLHAFDAKADLPPPPAPFVARIDPARAA